MMRRVACLISVLALAALLGLPAPASATHENDDRSKNLHPKGESLRAGAISNTPAIDQNANSDLAFWGKYAIQGRYDGFRIIDISSPDNPVEVTYFFCRGNQGDITVWGDLLVRSINSPMSSDQCDAVNVSGTGFEGLQIFDISDIRNPRYLKSVATDCGSHTQSLVPDLEKNRLIIYSSTSGTSNIPTSPFGNTCTNPFGFVDIVEIPLDSVMNARVIGKMDLRPSNQCHDIAIILGEAKLAACAGAPLNVLFDISDPANPVPLRHWTYVPRPEEQAGNPDARNLGGWHSAAFTWDAKIIASGWEPGGGGAAECEAGDPDYEKAIFFYSVETGDLLGRWVHPRPQGPTENCTIHNYNVLPLRDRYVLVHGSYQSGTSVVDFTDPANAYEVAYSDPAPLSDTSIILGGAWSTYWYNNFIYESDITRGLRVYRLSDKVAAGTMRLPYLNPQTQEFTIEPKAKKAK